MKRNALIGLCVLALFAASEAGAGPPTGVAAGWHAFRSLPGRFEVLAPGASKREGMSRWTLAGPIEEVAYHFDWRGSRFGVTYHDLPRIASVIFTPESLLERAQEELLDFMNGELLSAAALTSQGWPGRSVTYRATKPSDVLEAARLFLVGSRLYIVEAATPVEAHGDGVPQPGAAAVHFLDSFQLLTADGTPY